ncbi:hypothetical protein SCLCIDRAFT_1224573 [Scleroderma citrinum Foug A]|uniref:Uncharacterized protein n=1 Tax=Scleroderma citrinum Foug A TaxID=1036808 RepID=A0A0C3D4L1_9AGAM|nr:hypothetical protein SCLCIDRAFT_1224573 [Scleroderma citrinum Foug A]
MAPTVPLIMLSVIPGYTFGISHTTGTTANLTSREDMECRPTTAIHPFSQRPQSLGQDKHLSIPSIPKYNHAASCMALLF